MTVSGLEVRDIRLAYGPSEVLNQVSLAVELNQTLAILGQSGCGKTTLLKVVAGLVAGSDGSVLYDGRAIDHLSAAQRRIVYLDQDPLLFEHLSVFENVAFAMRLARRPRNEIRARVTELLAAVELTDHAHKRSWQLSGGQKQRVAFARAILASPRVLLLDEPFGSLDSRSRANMQQLFLRLREQYSITCLFVTHDVKEALVVGDRLALMADGKLKQYASHGEFMQDESTGAASEREFWLKQEQR